MEDHKTMSLFAISDLHLALQVEKPMDVFGADWKNHHDKIAHHWRNTISENDTIVISGDISWAMKLAEAADDLNFIDALPGKKVMIKGNHDYWWESYTKIKKALPESIVALQNNHYPYDNDYGIAICGTRGWQVPSQSSANDYEHDQKIFRRELHRLELSLNSAWQAGYNHPVVALHYPPIINKKPEQQLMEIMQLYNVKICLYGHLHGKDHAFAYTGCKNGIRFFFTACDYLNFKPLKIDTTIIYELFEI